MKVERWVDVFELLVNNVNVLRRTEGLYFLNGWCNVNDMVYGVYYL